ncbi:DMT family transporter [Microvirga lotononidis]|uniref:DMT(Drug/metabolite transporter) superfamily permease n=1 Tax=Microvirga lotononidis TaxID=864069 RepID=I4YXZ6_9HYPH|nr:DMT family transporter [Microvirga lotononidis]EIM28838.1 DMT(drug/metabolite transporter) superfamily permease [Microvirga lotononidis]WQO25435.1 DMT family transporter [Microvirga lotononidis]
MSLVQASEVQTRTWASAAIGILWGMTAALAWTGYNVGSRLGRMEGLQAVDMSMLRFGVAALLLMPLVLSRRKTYRLGWGRLLSLTVLAGPLFGLLINTAFGLAPLSHAVVLTAGATMMSANGLAWRLDGRRPPIFRLLGMMILIVGLLFIASAQNPQMPQSTSQIWLGDLCFLAAGSLWGSFTYLLGRWKVDPIVGIGQVSFLSVFAFLPFFLARHHDGAISSDVWMAQAFFQGILGGCLAPVAIAKAVSRVGAGEAALFPALVPSGALLLAIPLLGEWPSYAEILGIGVCTLGLLTSFDLTRFLCKSRISG